MSENLYVERMLIGLFKNHDVSEVRSLLTGMGAKRKWLGELKILDVFGKVAKNSLIHDGVIELFKMSYKTSILTHP